MALLDDLEVGTRFRTGTRKRVLTKHESTTTLPVWCLDRGKPHVIGYSPATWVKDSSGRLLRMLTTTEVTVVE